jgi:hypothetical protein
MAFNEPLVPQGDTGGVGKTRWVLVTWMFVISSVAYLDRVNISIAAKDIAAEFHLTNAQLGPIFSAFPMDVSPMRGARAES